LVDSKIGFKESSRNSLNSAAALPGAMRRSKLLVYLPLGCRAAGARTAGSLLGSRESNEIVICTALSCSVSPARSRFNAMFYGASNQLGEFDSGATAAVFGAVGSVVAGGVGTLLIAAAWFKLFPVLVRRDRMMPTVVV
jgi:hypothetical protein